MTLIFSFSPMLAAQQTNWLNTLNNEATATDSIGIRGYSEHLIKLLPLGAVKPTYVNSFSDRLSKAEELARQGKRPLISEETIAEAFDDLMQQTAAPSSFQTNIAEVEKSRRAFAKELPAIISENRNGKYCYPDEAIWVMEMLIENVESHPPQPLHSGPEVSGYTPPVRNHLMQYFYSHSPKEVAHVLDKLAEKLGI